MWSSSYCSVAKSRPALQRCELQHARLPCPSLSPWVCSNYVHWVSDAIQPSLPLLSPSPPAFYLSQYQSLSQWVSSSHKAALVLELQLQDQFFWWMFRVGFDWVVYDHAQFTIEWFDLHAVQGTLKSLPQHNSLKASALWFNLLYGLNLTSIPDYWKNLKFDYMDLCWQSDVSVF